MDAFEICKIVRAKTGVIITDPQGAVYDWAKYRGRHPEFEKLDAAIYQIVGDAGIFELIAKLEGEKNVQLPLIADLAA